MFGLEDLSKPLVYVFQHNGQLPIEQFHFPFGRKLNPNNR
jgi:hypothetical protein